MTKLQRVTDERESGTPRDQLFPNIRFEASNSKLKRFFNEYVWSEDSIPSCMKTEIANSCTWYNFCCVSQLKFVT